MKSSQVRALLQAASGRRSVDVALLNLRLVNVHTGRVEEGVHLGILGDRFAYVGRGNGPSVGPRTRVVDAKGAFALPGLIDAHTHLDSIFTLSEYVRYALLGGNTCAVTETSMIANALGADGVWYFMESSRGLPFRLYFLTPALIPPFPEFETSRGFDREAFDRMIRWKEVLGVGETYWPRALDLDPRFLHASGRAHGLGKTREGHGAGARGDKLMAYAAGGITSCHEATTVQEAFDRLRLGMAVQIREGYIRRELEAVAPLVRELEDRRSMMLVTDLAPPEELIERGAMMDLVRKAVALGIPPVTAVQMASLNPARYFGLRDLGSIAPGRYADLVLVEDLERFRCLGVWMGGKEMVREGVFLGEVPAYRYPEAARRSIRTLPVEPDRFRIPAPADGCRVRAVSLANETITREEWMAVRPSDGGVEADPSRDLLKMAVINRDSPAFRGAIGFVHNTDIRRGALATTLIWDTCNILVVGTSDREMACAVNRLIEDGGGFYVVEGETLLASCPLPVGGILSEASLPEIVSDMRAVERALRSLGCRVARPFMTFQTLCFSGLPFLRLTDRGLLDVRKGAFVDLLET